ncbi:hypothetical protein B0H10DRAFT_1079841 [Mycena sp. CBHHK59/15]|nr:hypothetical protein B0H10DRAFT_1079841 [Mycena sp. CBHHK59/15]
MASLEKTSLERCRLVVQIRKHQGTRSPLRRLPTELLSLIFAFTNIPAPALFEFRSPPWNLGQVCIRWRAIVLAQPALWCSIYFDSRDRYQTKFRLETQLQRAGRLPLDITFLMHKQDASNTAKRIDMLGIIARHCARWQQFALKCPARVYPVLSCIRHSLPLLRELRIQISAASEVQDVAASLEASADIFQVSPNLQAAYIDVPATMSILLPTSQLLRYRGTWNGFLEAVPSGS